MSKNNKFKNEGLSQNKTEILSHEEYMQKREVLTSFFSDKSYVPMTLKEIAHVLSVKKEERNVLKSILEDLENKQVILLDSELKYIPLQSEYIITGKFEAKSKKYGFVNDFKSDLKVYIPQDKINFSLNNDIVLVKLSDRNNSKEKGKLIEGEILSVVKRNTTHIIGKFLKSRNYGFVTPLDLSLEDVYIPKKYIKDAADGDIVKVEILKYATKTSKSEGKIVELIGSASDKNVYVKALRDSYNLDEFKNFNDEIIKEADKIQDKVLKEEYINREDRRDDIVVTIDDKTAKDLDDGVSVKKGKDGNYILSVYIADVSHYVKENSKIDNEAINRGTSIYIPNDVIPMLPKKLSNGICSLNEGVDRLALAIDIKIDPLGEVIDSNIFKAVINVKKRMTYDKVYKVLELEDMEVLKEYAPYEEKLFLMKELALLLNKKRMDKGSIDFDIKETKIILDDERQVVDIKPYDITIANKIIEEFMLCANMQIAEKFYFLDIPFIYRIHEKPDEEKLRDLNEVLSFYNKKIKGLKNIHPKALSTILNEINNEEEKQVISTFMLRTLKLARYHHECVGHFGLAAKYYCHFTSPIRRYPDLFIHRVISDMIESSYVLDEEKIQKYKTQAVKYAKIASEMEKQATLIERDFDNLYMCMYMSDKYNIEYEGVVSSITSFGMFVRLENTIEGFVSFSNMPSFEYYEYDEKRRILIGRDTGDIYKIGDKVKVVLSRCSIEQKQIDFEVIEKLERI